MFTLEDIQQYLDKILSEKMVLSYNTRISDLGFDSLELLELISYIEKKYFIEIKLSEINGQLSMQEFIELINNGQKSQIHRA